MTTPQITMRPLSTLRGYDRNARTHSPEQVAQIAASIKEYGFTNPLLIAPDGEIIAGHGRFAAAEVLNLAEAPCIELGHLTDVQRRAYVLKDNQLALNAGWDTDLLRSELEALAALDVDLDSLGFGAELDALLNSPSTSTGDPDALPDAPETPTTASGDVWLLGRHRILCGDSTSPEVVARLMAGAQADLLFTSPPYAQQRDYGAAKEQVQGWDALMQGVFSAASGALAPAAQVLVNLGLVHRDGEWVPYWDNWISWMREQGWRRFGWYVWDQGPGLPGDWNGRPAPSHEFIFHFNGEARRANKSAKSKMAGVVSNGGLRAKDGSIGGRTKGASAIQATKVPDSVFRVMRHKGGLGDAGKHPAVFPVALCAEIFAAYAQPGMVAYEPFCGAGSQVIAAEQFGAIACGMELDPAYVDVAVRRWEAFTDRVATLEATGQTFREVAEQRALARLQAQG